METLIGELIDTLAEQEALYDRLLALVEDEQQALKSETPDEVLGLVRRKETLVLEIRTLEESRRLICGRLVRKTNLGRMALPESKGGNRESRQRRTR